MVTVQFKIHLLEIGVIVLILDISQLLPVGSFSQVLYKNCSIQKSMQQVCFSAQIYLLVFDLNKPQQVLIEFSL